MPAQRPVRRPLPGFFSRDVPVTAYPSRPLWRLHETRHPAINFGLNPGHRFSHPSCPFPVLYLAEAFTTCLWERFGEDLLNEGSPVSASLWMTRSLSEVHLPKFRLCDLTDETTRARAGVDLSALTHPDLSVPQEWGLAVQQHSAGFDGLRYRSGFDHQPCIALFQRPGIVSRLRERFREHLVDSHAGDAFLARHQIALV